jgi:hypothetical protein
MGLLKGLLSKDGGSNPPAINQKPRSSPGYERINMWIESRIGKIDLNDPGNNKKIENLFNEQKAKYPSARGKLILTPRGNDTLVTGDTIHFKNRLRSLGCKWDAKMRYWVATNKKLTEDDIDTPSELIGLKAYINTIPYRTKF